MPTSLPTRRLPERPDLDQLKRQAKELLDGFLRGDTAAAAEVGAHYRDPDPRTFALHDAQLTLARAYGFESWPKMKAFVEGANVRRLVEAIRAGDVGEVRALLTRRPELARMSHANLGMLHHALLHRSPEIVRVLMRHGAPARMGVYPFRDATTAHALASARGDEEILRIIGEEEPRQPREHRPAANARPAAPAESVAAAAAVARGDADWLRRQHAAGTLVNDIDERGGLLRLAVTHDRPDILRLLLDFGLDPDERIRFTAGDDYALSWGMPLQAAVALGRYEMAALLLERGADPNASIYASGDPMWSAYEKGDARMIELLTRYGGLPTANAAGAWRQVDLARRMLAGEAPYRREGAVGESLPEQLIWGAAGSGEPEIVRMALDRLDWRRDDPRWFALLEQTLRHDHDSPRAANGPNLYLACFALLIARCDPSLRGRPTDEQQFGLTPLHLIVARGNIDSRERVAFATVALDGGASLELRDHLLASTPLGWACRWGQLPLVELFLARGADPGEPGTEPWARPRAWAARMGHAAILDRLAG